MPLNTSDFLSSARNIAGTVAGTAGTIVNTVNTLKTQGFGAALRSINLLPGGETGSSSSPTTATFKGFSRDWRVRLSLPNNPAYMSSIIMSPLKETNGLVFPYTPTIQIVHSATYQPMSPVHNNYPFLSYENSKVDAMTITAPFYCEDAREAQYWVACMHYLKSVTKMSFGADSTAGAPPPVVKLNGYGDYVFNNVPVVVTSFTMDLPNESDYISTGLSGSTASGATGLLKNLTGVDVSAFTAQGVAWAPVKSTITVTVQPLYTRQQVRNFSLDKFVKGDYVIGTSGDRTGFI